MSISIAHRIELKPNNKQKTHFRKAFGCARLAWNWGLAEWQRQYKEGDRPSAFSLKKQFNAIKGERYPFVYEVTKYATQQPFIDLEKAYKKFFKEHTGSTKSQDKKREEYREVINLLNKGYAIRDVAKLTGKGISTVQRVKKEFVA